MLKSAADKELNDTEYQSLLLIYYQSIKIPLTAVSPLRDHQKGNLNIAKHTHEKHQRKLVNLRTVRLQI